MGGHLNQLTPFQGTFGQNFANLLHSRERAFHSFFVIPCDQNIAEWRQQRQKQPQQRQQ